MDSVRVRHGGRGTLFVTACPTKRQHAVLRQTNTFCRGARVCQINISQPEDVDQGQWLTLTAKPSHKGLQKEVKLWFCFTEKDYDTAMKKITVSVGD